MTNARSDLTAEFVRSILDYEPATGVLRWKQRDGVSARRNHRMAGKMAGWRWTNQGGKSYVTIRIDRRNYLAHRLAWLVVTGEWPEDEIDHIDGDGLNNRFSNLRSATRAENGRNCRIRRDNTSGFKGIGLERRTGRWFARITYHGRYRHLGTFDTREAAHAAYVKAAEALHGEFARTS